MKLIKISPTLFIDLHKVDAIFIYETEVIFWAGDTKYPAKKTDKLMDYLENISYNFTGEENE